MSSGPVRRVSRQDIQLVQNLIERCLQLYMNQKEVVDTLLEQAKIEPGFTELVWQKLEEENREFFKAYYLRLMVKHQIMEFNKLLEQQVHHMRQLHPTGVASIQNTNGSSHLQSMNQKQLCYASDQTDQSLKSENAHHPMASTLSNPYLNGSSTLNTNVASSVNISTHARRVDASPNMLSSQQTTNIPMMHGMNGGGMIKSETAYTNPASYMYGGDRNVNVLDGHSNVGGDTSIGSFSNESNNNNQPISDQLLDAEASTFGFLGQIPRNFSLSDLTADFSQTEILESYDRSPFLGAGSESFLDSRDSGDYQGDNKRLETISEGFSYDNLGSE